MSNEKLNKYLFIPNDRKLNIYNHNSFILPLKGFSIGFDVCFSVQEINELSKSYNIFVIMNKFLHKKDITKIEKIIKSFGDNIKGYLIEDFGLTEFIEKEKVILYPNHIINNYTAINYISTLGFKNITVSNELTVKELVEIRKKTNSVLFYNLISKNMIMYSKRKLVSNYYENFKIDSNKKTINLSECAKGKKLIIKEENGSSVIYNYDLFCANKHLNKLSDYDYFIVNFTLLNKKEKDIVLKNFNSNKLYKLIDCDYYFLENEIKYKVKDL